MEEQKERKVFFLLTVFREGITNKITGCVSMPSKFSKTELEGQIRTMFTTVPEQYSVETVSGSGDDRVKAFCKN